MKSPWLAVSVVPIVVFLWMTRANSDEPAIAPAPTADPMLVNKPGAVRDDNSLKMKFVWCPPGKFTMGSPRSEKGRQNRADEDQVSVTLTNGFWLGQTEVTQVEWRAVMGTTPWKADDDFDGREGDRYPVTSVDWYEAQEFCRKLSLRDDARYRLPTEAEWEYACRGGTTTRFSFGDNESQLGECAWYSGKAEAAAGKFAHEVGRKQPNPFGLHDMHGNAAEWCEDFYAVKLPGGTNPQIIGGVVSKPELPRGAKKQLSPNEKRPMPKEVTEYRPVYRGGSWRSPAGNCRSASRSYAGRMTLPRDVGFRVARVVPGFAGANRAGNQEVNAILNKAIDALGGEARLSKAEAYFTKSKGTNATRSQEALVVLYPYTFAVTVQGLDRFRSEFDATIDGKKVRNVLVLNGDHGWRMSGEDIVDLDANAIADAKRIAYLYVIPHTIVPLKTKSFEVEKAGEEKVAGKPAVVLKVTGPEGEDFTLSFDKESGLPVKLAAKLFRPQDDLFIEEKILRQFTDYDGIKRPIKLEIKRTERDRDIVKNEDVIQFKVLEKVDADDFAKPR